MSQNTQRERETTLASRSALVVGVGGLGCPATLALVRAGVGRIVLADDDRVDLTNLHRQILFGPDDVGRDKLDAAAEALQHEGPGRVELVRSRFLPHNARELARTVDVVVEGADNFATKFLAADACHLENTPVIHGAGVRWHGTAWSVSGRGKPCYRCLFEDLLPEDESPNCAEAGVVGPVVGVIGALMADLALDVLLGDSSRVGCVLSFDGVHSRVRNLRVSPRPGCPLCGTPDPKIAPINAIEVDRYWHPTCAAPARSALSPSTI